METNIGIIEQALRFLIGIGILVYAAVHLCCTNLVVALIISAFLLGTGGIGYCPICALFNRNRGKLQPKFRLK
ncbi:MAG: DUF2892 domain-containing protein [Candidatus Micrarchaeota archaeon]|nr:DUF2892 domain-containing protein [Candidatus Micrarchaeota archaeon]